MTDSKVLSLVCVKVTKFGIVSVVNAPSSKNQRWKEEFSAVGFGFQLDGL